MNHTPFPWDLNFDDKGDYFICTRGQWNTIAIMPENFNRKDAQLIAAAPELLEALKLLWQEPSSLYAADKVFQAINKAEGK